MNEILTFPLAVNLTGVANTGTALISASLEKFPLAVAVNIELDVEPAVVPIVILQAFVDVTAVVELIVPPTITVLSDNSTLYAGTTAPVLPSMVFLQITLAV